MTTNNTLADILNYWRTIELFSPQNIPRPAPSDRNEPVYSIEKNAVLPWNPAHSLKREPLDHGKSRRFQVYCGIFKLERVRTILEEKFGTDPESFDERIDGESCLFSFSVTDDGRPLFDSYVLSTCAWATARTLNPGPSNSEWLNGFDDYQYNSLYQFSEHLAILHDDNQGQELKNKGFNLGRPIEYYDVLKETQFFVNELGLTAFFKSAPLEIRIKVSNVSFKKKFSTDDQDFLNSFFVKDLGKISSETRKGNVGKGLRKFLTEDSQVKISERIDVRTSINSIFHQLSPSLIPSGRWTSKGHHPLVFSQQFAVNTAIQQLASDSGLFSVNGPPGTGKTTLLRDLLAAIIVERAKKLSALKAPDDAFLGAGRWKSGDYTRVISLWNEQFKGFETVVASNNNGAVENITLEIPGIEAIDASWLNEIDYFPDVASQLIEQDAWAMIAARLGNKTNRNKFTSRFWYGIKEDDLTRDKTSTADITNSGNGLLNRLKNYETQTIDWKKSVNLFNTTLEEEERIRNERVATYNNQVEYFSLQQEIPLFEKELSELSVRKNSATLQLQDSLSSSNELYEQLAYAKQDRLQNHKLRPSLIEIILSLGKRFRQWDQEDARLQEKIIIAQRNLDRILKLKFEKQQEINALDQETWRISELIYRKHERIQETHLELIVAEKKLGNSFPNPLTWKDNDDQRELSSPWSDPEWDKSRAKVFLAALSLHKAFLISNAAVMRKNLQGAMDVLSGSVPETASPDAVASAWTSLFFVVPVISTTFASFDRLFTHLGRESLGWLLIDEAGQAAPQTAAGAIWRSRRTVVVGDPLQLEPVVTIPFTVQQALRQHHNVAETWLPGRTSVQQLADRVNQFGTYLSGEDSPLWVGSPLPVHRRCDKKIFDISNEIAYGGLMVFGTSVRAPMSLPESTWIDVNSEDSDGHWIPAEGLEVVKLIRELLSFGVSPNEIFLISPFRTVVRQLKTIALQFGEIKVGTIHTVQGKESDVAILVLGGNPAKPGAKQWASERPNLLNVAASRAKRRFYVVGNREVWRKYKYFSVCAAKID